MFDFSEDEFLFMLAAGVAGAAGIIHWVRLVSPNPPLRDRLGPSPRLGLLALPAVCLAMVTTVIWNWADPAQVAGHVDYLILFLAGAATWFGLTVAAISALGIHLRYDVVESGNPAAAISIVGATLANALIYAGGNIGAGPTIWTTIFPAAVGSLALCLLWFLVEATTLLSDAITIDRDQASGIRVAGWAIASSIVLGRSVAGDWTGWDSTFEHFIKLSWPAAALTAGMILIQIRWRPSPERPHPSAQSGLLPALAMVLAAILYVMTLPPPEIGEHVITYDEYMNYR
ncbi:MAG: hypothetical protein ACREF4_02405 [Gammaproteobacteria bacterium]